MSTPRLKQRKIARTRVDILEAAGRAFARRGHKQVTMQDIAREAGYTAASLYTYFRGKKEIAEELLRVMKAEYIRTFDEPMPGGLTFEQKLHLIITRQLELADQRRPVFASFFTVNPGGGIDDCRGGSFHKNFEERIQVLADWLRKHATPEDIGGHDPDLVARFLVGFGFGLVHRSISAAPKERLVDKTPLILDFFFNGVRGSATTSRKVSP